MSAKNYDIAVIGGGPAGMMAAGRAGELGARVILIEKNDRLGIKLLIAGHGRCNITNKIDNLREMVSRYGKNGKFLFSAFSKFGPAEVIDFFESREVKTKVEKGSLVFPQSDRGQDVLAALTAYLKKSKVELRLGAEVGQVIRQADGIEKVMLTSGEEIAAAKFVLCTGGKSYPATGSTGDGYKWLEGLGHNVIELLPALAPIIIQERFVKELEGLSLKGVRISLLKDNKMIERRAGEAIFTAKGMSGPLIHNLSKRIAQELPGRISLQLDLEPSSDFAELDRRLQAEFQASSNKQFKNGLDNLLPQKLIPVMVRLAGIDPDKRINLVSREERIRLVRLIKEFGLTISGVAGFDKAIVTAGGIDLSEVDPKTMRSKLIDNLYLAGEVMDLDGPTGGYNLQVCWSTGYAAGEAAALR